MPLDANGQGWGGRVWETARPGFVALLSAIRRQPWLHRPIHALAVKASRFRFASRFIQAVLEEHYLTAYEYKAWIAANDTLTDLDRSAITTHISTLTSPPRFSVVMPVYDTDAELLRQAIASVRRQLYPHWELCIADDASPGDQTWEILQDEARRDSRIKLIRRLQNGHISAASNSALGLATGEFVVLLDHDDLLAETALYEVAVELAGHPHAKLIYSDEDKITETGERFDPHFKTGWNPELMLGQNMVNHLCVIRRTVVQELGGFRAGFEGSQDYDLALRVVDAISADDIRHIPAILYHWRQVTSARSFSARELDRCAAAAQRAVREHLMRQGDAHATVQPLANAPAYLSVRRSSPAPRPLVSIIIPTRDRAELLRRCVDGVLRKTNYQPLELIIVDNDSVQPETHALLRKLARDKRVRVLQAPGPFNYSAINNMAAAEARGEILLFLNNDVEVTDKSWLDAMIAQAVRQEVGAVGAALFYADGRVQHGGVILGVGGDPPVAGHLYARARTAGKSYFNHLRLARTVSAVTAACLAVRKSVFLEAGGFDEVNLAVAFNDVDLCLKIAALGYQNIWTPLAALYHLESASRGSDETPDQIARFRREIGFMRAKWGDVLDSDPFYGPNFDKAHVDYRLASPPARAKPWKPNSSSAG